MPRIGTKAAALQRKLDPGASDPAAAYRLFKRRGVVSEGATARNTFGVHRRRLAALRNPCTPRLPQMHQCDVTWCNLRSSRGRGVTSKKPTLVSEGTRASVTFPAGVYAELEKISEEKKVSVAWVVRDAVEMYVESRTTSGRRGAQWRK